MSVRKDRISKKLKSINACWAITARKCVLPDDGFESKPSYHVHPDQSFPHDWHIKKFSSLREIEEWIKEMKNSIED